MQSREKGYLIPPSQVQYHVTYREARDETADFMQMPEEAAQTADVSRVSTD